MNKRSDKSMPSSKFTDKLNLLKMATEDILVKFELNSLELYTAFVV